MPPGISDYIFKKSFKPYGHKLALRNETSHTLFSKWDLVLIKELKEDGLTLELPLNTCQVGHTLTLFFLSTTTDAKITLPDSGHFKEAQFEAMAKVLKLESNIANSDTVFVELHFTQYDLNLWKKILVLYSKNQEEINELLKKLHPGRD